MNKDEVSYKDSIIAGILTLAFFVLLIVGVLYGHKLLMNHMVNQTVENVKAYVEMNNSEDN